MMSRGRRGRRSIGNWGFSIDCQGRGQRRIRLLGQWGLLEKLLHRRLDQTLLVQARKDSLHHWNLRPHSPISAYHPPTTSLHLLTSSLSFPADVDLKAPVIVNHLHPIHRVPHVLTTRPRTKNITRHYPIASTIALRHTLHSATRSMSTKHLFPILPQYPFGPMTA